MAHTFAGAGYLKFATPVYRAVDLLGDSGAGHGLTVDLRVDEGSRYQHLLSFFDDIGRARWRLMLWNDNTVDFWYRGHVLGASEFRRRTTTTVPIGSWFNLQVFTSALGAAPVLRFDGVTQPASVLANTLGIGVDYAGPYYVGGAPHDPSQTDAGNTSAVDGFSTTLRGALRNFAWGQAGEMHPDTLAWVAGPDKLSPEFFWDQQELSINRYGMLLYLPLPGDDHPDAKIVEHVGGQVAQVIGVAPAPSEDGFHYVQPYAPRRVSEAAFGEELEPPDDEEPPEPPGEEEPPVPFDFRTRLPRLPRAQRVC